MGEFDWPKVGEFEVAIGVPVQHEDKSSAQQRNSVGARGWVLTRGKTRCSAFIQQHLLALMTHPACKAAF